MASTRYCDLPKIISAATVLALTTPSPAKADCLSYGPTRVSIAGTLNRIVFSNSRGDPEPYIVLRLQQPVCMTGEARDEDKPFLSDILAIQLLLTETQYAQFRPLLGKRVRLSGSLVAAETGHHHTPVIMGDVVLAEEQK